MPLSFRLFSVGFSLVCFGVGMYTLACGILGKKMNILSCLIYTIYYLLVNALILAGMVGVYALDIQSFQWHDWESAAFDHAGVCIVPFFEDGFLAGAGCCVSGKFYCLYGEFCVNRSDFLLQPNIWRNVSVYVYHDLYSIPGSAADGCGGSVDGRRERCFSVSC